MAVNFSELLDANRLRPLWGPGQPAPAEAEKDAQARKNSLDGDADGTEQSAKGHAEDPIPDAPLEIMPKESPIALLDKLEVVLRMVLGPRAMMLTIYLAPLRRTLSAMEGVKHLPHPLQQALVTNNLPMLVYRLEDSIRALLRTKQALIR